MIKVVDMGGIGGLVFVCRHVATFSGDWKIMRVTVAECKEGEFIKLTEKGSVWVRGEYCRSLKQYEVYLFDDTNHSRFIAPNRAVWVDFTF